ELPDHVRKSWLSYDHFYSDDAFSSALPIVFNYKPERILDVGGNTGKWAKSCLSYNENVHVGIVDLPGQIEMAKKNTQEWMESGRISFYATNVLSSEQKLPSGFDIIWMSQFLDCFSEEEMLSILEKCADALSGEGLVMILEPLWDRQRFEAAAFSLQQASLYFTTIANGNSQMYRSDIFLKCISAAGFEVIDHFDHIGRSQSLMVCKKNNSCKK
ncbi:MAG: methyltransferase domain-containing protein, partial [Crocinitomicaceae bacterium]|nr:methyltransferase domain-containing protein [Crocinitomicaceae bacterium]